MTNAGMIAGLEKTRSKVAMYLDSGTYDLLADLARVVLDETQCHLQKGSS
jgi:hypothetical protein